MTAMDSYALSKFNEYNRWGRLADLDEAVRSMEQIVFEAPETHASRAGLLHNLSVLLGVRFERQGRTQDLEQAIDKSEQALRITPRSHSNFITYSTNLGNKLQQRFERTGRTEDLDSAIRIAQEALEAMSEGDPHTAGCMRDLSVKLIRRFERFGRTEDLDEAIRLAEEAVEAMSTVDAECAKMLHNLANMYEDRYSSTGKTEDMERAINAATKAVNKTPPGHPHRANMSNSLGMKLKKRFEVIGSMEDLEEAVRIAEYAVDSTPEDHPYHAGCLINLGHILWRRFERTGRSEDLEKAICNVEDAVKTTPEGSPDSASRSNSLGALLYTRYERIGRMKDLERAIVAIEDSIASTPKDHPRLKMLLNNVSVLLVNRFDQSGKVDDLDDAIKRARESVRATRDDDPSQAAHWNNLGNALKRRFEATGDLEALEQAIQNATYSVKATPEDHVDLSGRLNNLGHCLCQSSQQDQQNQALECFKRSWSSVNGVPFHRVDAARQAVRLLKERHQWREAATISKEAIDLLPTINNRSLDRQDQLHAMSKFSGLVSDACSLSLQIGDDAAEALKLLERGRGVIMGLLIEDRSDISQLRALHPEQAAYYDRLRNEINQTTQVDGELNAPGQRGRDRVGLVAKLQRCVNDIRDLPGFERFLLSPTSGELMALASQGPISVVNVTALRSDAFVISPSTIKCIELPGMTAAKVKNWAKLTSDMSKDYITRNKEYRQFLKQLWSECVKLILAEVQGERPSGPPFTRMWWIGVGDASALPFHAAGEHFRGCVENAASWVISSYIPTLKALSYARERERAMEPINALSKILIVAMPETPGQAPLHYISEEMSAVQTATNDAFSSIPLVQPNAKSVLSYLGQCDMVHFACHGVSDRIDPLSSYLMLQNNASPTPTIDKITVRQISDASLRNARVAYLSACSTAENKAHQLADEVIHLASGFQIAGFSHVVASMWVADDQVCVQVAKGFYERLVGTLPEQRIHAAIAAALHGSVEEIRSRYSKAPLQWAPFIHIGA